MEYGKITKEIIEGLIQISGRAFVNIDEESLRNYGHDETEDLVFLPEVVVKPCNTFEVSEILKLCNLHQIPLTPRGGGTGLSGGALPIHGGILLSMERFNNILEIDERNLQAIVEPGVITQVFQEEVIKRGLYYPPDPSSRGSCHLGGNLAESAGGPRAVKYGLTRDYVLGLEVVLPGGEIINTGARVLKNSTGYNLTQLFIGSEGTLGIITKIIFKLIPYPTENIVMLVPFNEASKACEAVSAVFRAGIIPSALEFMERDAIDWALKYIQNINIPVEDDVKAHLLIELDGNDMDQILKAAEKTSALMESHGSGEILFADDEAQKNNLWRMRRNIAEAVKSNSVYKEEDTVVPRAELPILLKGIKEIGNKYGFRSICYGHAGDGNLHVNILKGNLTDAQWEKDVPLGISEIFKLCMALGGMISGEHGIGYVQKPFIDIALSEGSLNLQRGIKKLMDPNNILNPGKIF